MEPERFIERVLARVTEGRVDGYTFKSWPREGKATAEGFGLLPVPGATAEKLLGRVMDVDRYTGRIPHVVECRAVADPRFAPPRQVRFYQRIEIPLLGHVHHELVLERIEAARGYEIAVWRMLEAETEALGSKRAIRSQYNEGAWLVAPGVVGYALSSAPRRDDVGFLKWKALTAGADALAQGVVRENISSMSAWAAAG